MERKEKKRKAEGMEKGEKNENSLLWINKNFTIPSQGIPTNFNNLKSSRVLGFVLEVYVE